MFTDFNCIIYKIHIKIAFSDKHIMYFFHCDGTNIEQLFRVPRAQSGKTYKFSSTSSADWNGNISRYLQKNI